MSLAIHRADAPSLSRPILSINASPRRARIGYEGRIPRPRCLEFQIQLFALLFQSPTLQLSPLPPLHRLRSPFPFDVVVALPSALLRRQCAPVKLRLRRFRLSRAGVPRFAPRRVNHHRRRRRRLHPYRRPCHRPEAPLPHSPASSAPSSPCSSQPKRRRPTWLDYRPRRRPSTQSPLEPPQILRQYSPRSTVRQYYSPSLSSSLSSSSPSPPHPRSVSRRHPSDDANYPLNLSRAQTPLRRRPSADFFVAHRAISHLYPPPDRSRSARRVSKLSISPSHRSASSIQHPARRSTNPSTRRRSSVQPFSARRPRRPSSPPRRPIPARYHPFETISASPLPSFRYPALPTTHSSSIRRYEYYSGLLRCLFPSVVCAPSS